MNHDLLNFDTARKRWLATITRLDFEVVELNQTLNRVLAADLSSDIDVSPFDNSAMDGFALRAEDIADASSKNPISLEVLASIAAGKYWDGELQAGQAVRIMTGAPVPASADSVVKIEDTVPIDTGVSDSTSFRDAHNATACIRKDRALFALPIKKGMNIRLAGEEVKAGECVLRSGDILGPAAVGLLAATGHAKVPTYRTPVVGIISTGEELTAVDKVPGKGEIRNSNAYSLGAQAMAAGAKVRQYASIPDTLEDTIAALKKATAECDLVISSGGVSVGDFDFVDEAVRSLGDLHFTSVMMRPGRPQTTGMI
ncbi:MAG: molybdopterin molybdotransferase MoeA, partial [Coriobacteriia bacterium]|nr:molybdopterin molybdotransferase MoeA [Coriobacteriia bacterium]